MTESTGRAHGVLVTYRRPEELEDHLRRLGRQTRPLASLLVSAAALENARAAPAHGLVQLERVRGQPRHE